jgi:hypothetical protein
MVSEDLAQEQVRRRKTLASRDDARSPANITWRQEVGGSAIEASKIAGHADLEMTGEYTFVAPERQNELTRRIQEKLAKAGPRPGFAARLPQDQSALVV